MRYSKLIRRFIVVSMVLTAITLALGSAAYPIWLEALKQFSLPLGLVLTAFMGVEGIKNYKKKQQDETL